MAAGPARADSSGLTRNLFGSPGLVDMPDARMAPDGELSAAASFFTDTQRYSLGFQPMPWLEVSFRYSGLAHFDPIYPVYYDRSFAVKARLWDETGIFPAVAVGINDLVGTGIYAGEYLVTTKRFGDISATLGLGWGRLGSANTTSNPLGLLSASFKQRTDNQSPGATNFGAFFHGRTAGLFGGLAWRTPIDGLSLVGEYSSDAYRHESRVGNFTPHSQFNVGLSYQPADDITLGLAWLYGDTISGTLSFQLNPAVDPYPARIGPAAPPFHVRTAEEQQRAIRLLAAGSAPRRHPAAAGLRRVARADALLDELWQAGAEDVAIHGRTLTLTIAKGDPRAACAAAAPLADDNDLELDAVTVLRAGMAPIRCAVPHSLVGNARITGTDLVFPTLVPHPASLITIDAAAPAEPSDAEAMARIRADVRAQLLNVEALSLGDSEALVYYNNVRYSHEADAIDRLIRVLMADAPSRIEKFRLIPVIGSVPMNEFDILRGPTERSVAQTETYNLFGNGNAMRPAPLNNPVLRAGERGTYPRFVWGLFPQFRQELFDPDNPFAVQFLGGIQAAVELLPGLSLVGEAEANIWDNFNTNRPPDSVLPHVRSDFLTYFTKGKNGIGDLEADYRFRLAPEVFAIARAGYLESMFAGVGGEVLWRPQGQRWALGIDLYGVKKRNFDRLLGLQDYKAFTGHISAYYASPWYDLNFAVHAGQYLAGDRGFTLEVTRRFSTGVEIGAFFTRTNVSAEQFGEGSFDKGIMIRIPLDWSLPINTQGQFNMDLRPVQRDGGQRLMNDTLLFEETRRTSEAEIR
jgi:hypothetical protein